MKRKQFLILGGSALMCVAILMLLYAFSPLTKKMYRGGFERKLAPANDMIERKTFNLGFNSYYIAGITADKIYLGNWTAPLKLVIVNRALTDTSEVKLELVGLDSIMEPGSFKLAVDSPYFFVSHGVLPIILRGEIDNWRAKSIMPDSAYFFVEAVPIGGSSFVLRSFSTTNQGYELAKKTTSAPYFSFNYNLLQKQVDGLFCLDGQLGYSKELNKLVYTHFYRNEFIVADTNLNLVYRGHTIDTFSHARVNVTHIESRNQEMLISPPSQINKRSVISGKYIFIESNLLAKNEDVKNFRNGSVIDVYRLADGNYLHSFYINKYKDIPLSHFSVNNNQLVALFGRHLVVYDLNYKYQD